MSPIHRLHQLANLYGLQTAYYDVHRRRQPASAESLLALLSCLGAPVASLKDIVPAWRQRRQELWQRVLEPVTLAWDGRPPPVRIRLPAANDSGLSCHLKLEDGTERSWQVRADTPVEAAEIEGKRYVVRELALPRRLPRGYHRLTLETGGKRGDGLIISAPKRAYQAEMTAWGPFLPLYALYTDRSPGSGDYSDMAALAAWAAGLGAQVVATLPLLATFADRADSSPYLPVSRRLWNEFYIALDRVPELSRCPAAQALMESSSFRAEAESLSRLPLVDYPRQMALKHQVLSELCRCLYREPSPRLEELQLFAGSNPVAGDYACFRAADEKKRVPWSGGKPGPGDYDEDSRRYYLYAQWLAHQQMAELAARVKGSGLRLYLDLPLGVHPGGYDVWSQRDLFINGTSAGAPPDIVFTRGQDWAFPPLHPERIREQGYEYVIAYLRHHLRHAGILRLDHVMGLHHLFCIPRGMGASQGVYLRYPAEELYAILSLESHRHQVVIVGEDLGTVPGYVRPAMAGHGLHRTYVLDYALASSQTPPVPEDSVASLNTHDMPPFAAFWQDLDIGQRLELGILDSDGASRERLAREPTRKELMTYLWERGWIKADGGAGAALRGCLSFLAASRARVLLVNLEDLWLETMPQNVPSTTSEYPNWRRKARYSLDEFCQMPMVTDTLGIINRLRRHGDSDDTTA